MHTTLSIITRRWPRIATLGLLALLIALCGSTAMPATAQETEADPEAESILTSTEPASGALLDSQPDEVSATFETPLDPDASSLLFFASDGEEFDISSSLSDDGTSLSAAIPENLPSDTYTVAWAATSDGEDAEELERGFFTFTFGEAALEAPITVPSTSLGEPGVPSWLQTGVHAIALAGLVGLAAAWPVWSLIVRPALRPAWRTAAPISQHMRWFAIGALAVAALGSVLVLLLEASALPTGSLLDRTVTTLTDSRFGTIWFARVAIIVGLGVALFMCAWWFIAQRRRASIAAWILSISLPLTYSLVSNAWGQPVGREMLVASDYFTLIALSLWFGGLAILLTVVLPGRQFIPAAERPRITRSIAKRFGLLTVMALITIVLSNAYTSWAQIGNQTALTTTAYGRAFLTAGVLLAGIALLTIVTAIGLRRMSDRGAHVSSPTRWLLVAQGTLAVVLLVAVGHMFQAEPARAEVEARGQQTILPLTLPDRPAHLLLAPGTAGVNHLRLELGGDDVLPEAEAMLELESVSNPELGDASVQLARVADNAFEYHGDELGMVGDWHVTLTLTADPEPPISTDATVALGETRPEVDVPADPWRFEGAGGVIGLTLLIVGAGGLVAAAVAGRTPMRKESGGLGTAALIIGCILLVQARVDPLLAGSGPGEAIDAGDIAMVTRGEEIYEQQCISCHGPELRGDGPQAEGMEPPPADFSAPHTYVHSDSDFIYWIRAGKQGTDMPGFGNVLSDQEIRDVLSFIYNRQAGFDAVGSVPEPQQCTISPREADDLAELTDAGDAPSRGEETLQPASDPEVDEETESAIIRTAEELLACANGDETLRGLALFSDANLQATYPDGLSDEARQSVTGTAVPLSEDDWIALVSVTEITRLVDGRVAANVSIEDPDDAFRLAPDADPERDPFADSSSATLVFVEEGDRWLIDEAR